MNWWLEALLTVLAAYGTLAMVQAGWRWASNRRHPDRPQLSVVVVLRNQERIVEGLLTDLLRQQDAQRLVNDVIAIDLGSTDNTPAILQRLARQHPEVRSLLLDAAIPHEQALLQALQLGRHPLTLCLDVTRGADLGQLRQTLAVLLPAPAESPQRAVQHGSTA